MNLLFNRKNTRYRIQRILTSFLFLFLVPGCQKSNTLLNVTGTIIGPNPQSGPCEGGFWILIAEHPYSGNYNGYYTILEFPPYYQLDSTTHYPVQVEISYSVDYHCDGKYVKITSLKEL